MAGGVVFIERAFYAPVVWQVEGAPGGPGGVRAEVDLPGGVEIDLCGRRSQGFGSRKRNAPVAFFVDGTIEMIDGAFIFNDKGFVGEHFVVRLGRFDEIGPGPVRPMDEIIGAGKPVECAMGTVPESAEIEHHIEIADLLNIGIAGDAGEMVEQRVAAGSCPMDHIVGDGHANAFAAAAFVETVAVGVII